jgi:hypothetical protein
MKKVTPVLLALLLASSFVATAFAAGPGPWYAKGSYYAGTAGTWNFDAGNTLNDDGLAGDAVAGDGIFTAIVVADQGFARHEFKIANADWSESYFGPCNLWVHCGVGDAVRFTFDTNTHVDGWMPEMNIVWSDHAYPAGTAFEVIGSAPETGSWNSGVPATLVGTVWTRVVTIATAGSYAAKFRAVGTWDLCNIGSEGAGAPCGADLPYMTLLDNTDVLFQFDSATGRARATVLGVTPAAPTTFGRLKTLYR